MLDDFIRFMCLILGGELLLWFFWVLGKLGDRVDGFLGGSLRG